MPLIDDERFRKTFEAYSEIGATENGGLHRLALSEADRRARDKFAADLRALNLDVRIDEVGNMFASRPGENPEKPPVLIGSHLDSQPSGGRFDGQLGVLTALETLRTLEDHDVTAERPVEIVNWTNEEGSRFSPAMMGSGVFAGELKREEILRTEDRDGVTVAEALEAISYEGDQPCESHDIHAALELHIEQGPKLESEGTSLGIVDGVFSMAWLEVTFTGEADHAGPTPMHTRRDALAAAVDAIDQIQGAPQSLGPDAVTTVGELSVEPNSVNVIPKEAQFTVDVRSADEDVVTEGIERVQSEASSAATRHGVTADVELIWQIPATAFSPLVREACKDAATTANVSYQTMTSGAGHDAKYLNDVTDAGMIFVPSRDGRTHTEKEFTPWAACVAGAETFFHATCKLAGAEIINSSESIE
ncbi:Zn-dependent hydrolase [Halobellus ordinarius]|uniref:Zn-dependent hydrolase n=1 Tax=Halobellus ordinarius TaxID=3075120 RepID=UPI0028801A44|nr:Zn-dependent hydrolase [Halobellus sp. ZY16]